MYKKLTGIAAARKLYKNGKTVSIIVQDLLEIISIFILQIELETASES